MVAPDRQSDAAGTDPARPGMAPPVKVMHLITSLQVGGAERMLEKLATAMDPAGITNIVVSLQDPGPIGRQLQAQGIAVHALDIRGPFSLPAGLFRLWRLLRRHRPRILQSWLYHADLVALLARRLVPSARLLWNIRCSDMNLADYGFGTRLVLRLLALASPLPDLVISNSESGRRHHDAIGYRARRWEIIPNGFDLDRFQPDPQAAARLAALLGLPAGTRMIAMVARFDPMKDHATFIAMAERLRTTHPDLHVLLAGRGCDAGNPMLAQAAARADGRLHLLGPRDDIAAILAGIDLLVLSSAYGEGFPNAVGEALACGTPCLGTNVGDVATIIGDCGAIVPPRDPAALAAAAARLLDMPAAERDGLRRRARQRAAENFALPVIVARYESLYRAVAATPRG